jgi:hypothetical protein
MAKFYTLSNAAGLIRSNKFNDKADAICVGSFRADYLNLPIKIWEHDTIASYQDEKTKCVFVCNPDGTVEKPEGVGYEMTDLGNSSSGLLNKNGAHILLSNYEDHPLMTFYLRKQGLSEAQVASMEKELGVELGLYDPQTLHAYTSEAKKIRDIEAKLAEAGVEVDRMSEASFQRAAETIDDITSAVVTAARKGHKMARASQLPELSLRGSNKFGGSLKFKAHCEMENGDGKKAPKIKVYVNGSQVGEVKSDREASKLIADEAESAVKKFLRKEF